MKNISCLNPITILHPSYIELFFKYDALIYFVSDVIHRISITSDHRQKIYDGVPLNKIFPQVFQLSSEEKLSVYLCIPETGECDFLFLQVPCGHCDACKAKKMSSVRQRLLFATEEYDYTPLFLTLTYNDSHLPADGVNKRDVQLFKKRLSKLAFLRFGVRLKFACFSEYGKLGRPHYHIIVYGFPLPKRDYFEHKIICQMIQFCWRSFPKSGFRTIDRYNFDSFVRQDYKFSNIRNNDRLDPYSIGFVNVSYCKNSNAGVISYVSKYVLKGSNVPAGKNPNFRLLSVKLGLDFVMSRRSYILQHPQSKFVFRSKFSNKVQEYNLSSYYINKLFPSFSKLVSPVFRRKWLALMSTSLWIVRNKYLPADYRSFVLDRLNEVQNKFPHLCLISEYSVNEKSWFKYSCVYKQFRYNLVYSCVDDVIADLSSYYEYFYALPTDFEDYVSHLVYERQLFLSRMSSSSDPVLSSISYKKQLSLLISKTNLL